jgi:hypothetical protein
MSTSGCLTTLGYVPEHFTFRKLSDTATYVPTYPEVKEWAYDVADGYDSRAIMNRQAIYAAALLAAAATGAITGLAAFDPGSSAITGIPIGTTFLAGVAFIYSSEEKARIYRLGSEYVKDLIALSDERLAKRRIAAQQSATALEEAKKGLKEASEKLRVAEQEEKYLTMRAAEAHKEAEASGEGPRKKTLSEVAEDADERESKATAAVEDAKLHRDAAQERVDEATRRYEAWTTVFEAKRELAQAEAGTGPNRDTAIAKAQLKVTAAENAWKATTSAEAAEALCLRRDVNDVMRKVEELKALLDPKNVVALLRDVEKAAEKVRKKATSEKEKAETAEAKLPRARLRDLDPPAKSVCDNAI